MAHERPATKQPHFWAAIGMIAFFFMPWVSLGPIDFPGYEVANTFRAAATEMMQWRNNATISDIPDPSTGSGQTMGVLVETPTAFWRFQVYALVVMIYLIPAVAMLCVILTLNRKPNRPFYALLGVLPFSVLATVIVHTGADLLRVLGIGFWFTMAGGVVALLGAFGLCSRPRPQPEGFPVG